MINWSWFLWWSMIWWRTRTYIYCPCFGFFLPPSSTCPNSKVMEKQQWDIKNMTEVQLGTPVSSFNLLPFFAEVIFFALVCKMRPISLSHFILEFLVRVSSNFIKPLSEAWGKNWRSQTKPTNQRRIFRYFTTLLLSLGLHSHNSDCWYEINPGFQPPCINTD